MVGQRLKAILLNSRKLGVRNGSASQKMFLWLSTSCKAWRKNKNTHLGLKLSTKLVRVSPASPVTQWSARRDSVSSVQRKWCKISVIIPKRQFSLIMFLAPNTQESYLFGEKTVCFLLKLIFLILIEQILHHHLSGWRWATSPGSMLT